MCAVLKTEKGFTLIELSIVIVIIGLIVAGVVGGQSLVKQSKFKTIISELGQFRVQINTFYLEYNNIPGDMPNADSYWSGCSSGATAAQCNGNGDGVVTASATATDNEGTRYWQHLSLSGLEPKEFDGTGRNAADCDELSCYYSKSGFIRYSVSYNTTHTTIFRIPAIRRNETYVQSLFPDNSGNGWRPSLTVPDSYSLDLKIDDGIANTGKFISTHRDTYATGCSANYDVAGGADYVAANLSDKSTKRCNFAYIIRN